MNIDAKYFNGTFDRRPHILVFGSYLQRTVQIKDSLFSPLSVHESKPKHEDREAVCQMPMPDCGEIKPPSTSTSNLLFVRVRSKKPAFRLLSIKTGPLS
jgi:hypothetical protein